MSNIFWAAIVVTFGGQMVWLIAAERAKKWLVQNDPTYEPPGFASRFFLGMLFTSFGPVSRYASMRRENGEPAGLASVFWIGFGLSMCGLVWLLSIIFSM